MADFEETRDDRLDGDGDEGGETPPEPPETDKRVRDLQSKADAAEARANKAEAALKASKARDAGAGDDPRYAVVLEQLREANLDAVYGEVTELRDFGIDRSLIEGSTREEMRESAAKLAALIGQVATKARNSTLAENGLTADAPVATGPKTKVDYDSMSKEDFDSLVKRAMR